MRRSGLGIVAVVAALGLVAAAPAQAERYHFATDKGTDCNVDVTAGANHAIGALAAPYVAFNAVPKCTYAAAGAAAGSNSAAVKRAVKACKAKPSKRQRARCKRKARKHHRATAQRAVPGISLLDLANLDLILPLGLQLPGAETFAALGLGGYACLLALRANCSDYGVLSPAVPLVSYTAQYSMRMTPPAGERWVTKPAGCSAAAVTQCVLRSAPATPGIL